MLKPSDAHASLSFRKDSIVTTMINILTTADEKETLERIGRALLERRLICVHPGGRTDKEPLLVEGEYRRS